MADLKLAEGMGDNYNLSPQDVADRLNFICLVQGVKEAEDYFNNVPDSLKTSEVFCSLLNCYADKKKVYKAEKLLWRMRKSGCNMKNSYMTILKLYSELGKTKKLEQLVRVMEKEGINCGNSEYYILLDAYAADSNVKAMEKLLKKMETGPLLDAHYTAFIMVAKPCLRAGLVDKARSLLNKAETVMGGEKCIGSAHEFLLCSYTGSASKDELDQLWHLYKERGNTSEAGYYYMIRSLISLDDIQGAEKIFQEWDSANSTPYDSSMFNELFSAYAKLGSLRKAEAIVNRAVASGMKVPAAAWDQLATLYYKDHQMEKAVNAMTNALFYCEGICWKLDRSTYIACFEYLKEKGDEQEEEKFVKLLREQGIFRLY